MTTFEYIQNTCVNHFISTIVFIFYAYFLNINFFLRGLKIELFFKVLLKCKVVFICASIFLHFEIFIKYEQI